MKEFKLIPLSEVGISVDETHSKPTHVKSMGDVVEVGNEDFNVVMKNLLTDKKTDEHFKLKLMNYISQKMDNKTNNDFPETSKDENKSRINMNIFDVIRSSIFAADIPNASRLFTYFVEKNDIQWNEHGVIEISGSKIDLDIYKLLKYLTTRNMKIGVDDREDLKRLLYTAYPIKKFIKNSHVIRLMDSDNDIDSDVNRLDLTPPTQTRVMRSSVMRRGKAKLRGTGLWNRW